MKKVILIVVLLTAFYSEAQSRKFRLMDSISKMPIEFVSINFKNGYGVFSNEKGQFSIADASIKIIELSHVSYESKQFELATVTDSILVLKPKVTNLLEVVISKKEVLKEKQTFTVKPTIHDDIFKMTWSAIAQQYAFLISSTQPNSYLKSISIPIIEKDFNQVTGGGRLKKQEFKTLIKLELYSNAQGIPGANYSDFEQLATIDSKTISNKFELLLNESIELPEEGLFVGLTILGKIDAAGDFIIELPYDENYVDGTTKKFAKLILPDYPLVESPNGVLTYYKFLYSEKKEWYRINKPMIYSKNKDYPFFNIGFGYKIVVKE